MKTIHIIALLTPLFGLAQNPCGSGLPTNTDTLIEQQFFKSSSHFDSVYTANYQQNVYNKTNSGGVRGATWMIPIRIWIIKNNAGTPAITEDEAFKYIDKVNEIFANNNTGIQFFAKCEVYYHTDGAYYESASKTYTDLKQETLRDYGALNIHFIYSNGQFGASASFPSDLDFFGLTITSFNNPSNGTMLAHEIGHCLGLIHPHQGKTGEDNQNETSKCDQEAVWRSRLKPFWQCFSEAKVCEKNGDRLCDTEASPKLSDYNVTSSGTYTGTSQDLWGNTWTPQTNLVMSYTPYDLGIAFTPQQIGLMQNAIYVLNSTYRIPSYMFKNTDIDHYEPDNRKGNARTITFDEQQHHTFNQHINLNEISYNVYQTSYSACDEDWITFNVTSSGTPIKIETSAVLGKPSPDTEIELYNAANTLIASNNNILTGSNSFSRIFMQSLPQGTYYVRLINHSPALSYNLTNGANGYHYYVSLNYENGDCFSPYLYGVNLINNTTNNYNLGALTGGENNIKAQVNVQINNATLGMNIGTPNFFLTVQIGVRFHQQALP